MCVVAVFDQQRTRTLQLDLWMLQQYNDTKYEGCARILALLLRRAAAAAVVPLNYQNLAHVSTPPPIFFARRRCSLAYHLDWMFEAFFRSSMPLLRRLSADFMSRPETAAATVEIGLAFFKNKNNQLAFLRCWLLLPSLLHSLELPYFCSQFFPIFNLFFTRAGRCALSCLSFSCRQANGHITIAKVLRGRLGFVQGQALRARLAREKNGGGVSAGGGAGDAGGAAPSSDSQFEETAVAP